MASKVSKPDSSEKRKGRLPPDPSKARNYAHKQKVQKAKQKFIENSKLRKAYAKVKASTEYSGRKEAARSNHDDSHEDSNAEKQRGRREPDGNTVASTQAFSSSKPQSARPNVPQEKPSGAESTFNASTSNRSSRKHAFGQGNRPKLGKQSKPLLDKVRSLMSAP